MKRVVADSNVLVSALQFGGKPMALLTLAEEGQIDLSISKAILTETLAVLTVKFQNTPDQLADREGYLRAITRIVTPSEAISIAAWFSSFLEKAFVRRVKRRIDIRIVRFWRST